MAGGNGSSIADTAGGNGTAAAGATAVAAGSGSLLPAGSRRGASAADTQLQRLQVVVPATPG